MSRMKTESISRLMMKKGSDAHDEGSRYAISTGVTRAVYTNALVVHMSHMGSKTDLSGFTRYCFD